jgi:hypothetical protein
MTSNLRPTRPSLLSKGEAGKLKQYSQAHKALISAATGLLFLHVLFASIILYTVLPGRLPKTFADADRVRLILHGLMTYFIVLPCISGFTHIACLRLCQSNLYRWRSLLAERLSPDEHEAYIKTPLKRIRLTLLAYPFVLLVHFAIAYMCHYLAGIVS